MVVENACVYEIIIKKVKRKEVLYSRYSIWTLEKIKNGERRRVIIIIERMLIYLLLAILMYGALA